MVLMGFYLLLRRMQRQRADILHLWLIDQDDDFFGLVFQDRNAADIFEILLRVEVLGKGVGLLRRLDGHHTVEGEMTDGLAVARIGDEIP